MRVLVVVAVLFACRPAEPACFLIESHGGIATSPSGVTQVRLFEAFVLANPPRERDALVRAVERRCPAKPLPEASAYSVQWWVFAETRNTPRTLSGGPEKQRSLDRHQDDLIFERVAQRGECGDFVSETLYRDGAVASHTTVPSPRPDGGPLPSWCSDRRAP